MPVRAQSSTLANAIQNLQCSIRTGKVRGVNGKDLTPEKLEDAKTKLVDMLARNKLEKAERAVERLQRHVTADGATTRAAVTADGDATRAAVADEAAQGRAAAAGSPHYLTRV